MHIYLLFKMFIYWREESSYIINLHKIHFWHLIKTILWIDVISVSDVWMNFDVISLYFCIELPELDFELNETKYSSCVKECIYCLWFVKIQITLFSIELPQNKEHDLTKEVGELELRFISLWTIFDTATQKYVAYVLIWIILADRQTITFCLIA